jgi:CRP-like cAMP-binding protein
LPKNLAIELSLFYHESTYKKISFLKNNASESFLAWICPQLKPAIFDMNEYVYFDGDEVTCIFFLKQGDCGFVLPNYQNIKYIDISRGSYFGVIDIIGSMVSNDEEELHLSRTRKVKARRQFTIQTKKKSELLTLSLDAIIQMDHEFPNSYNDLFASAYSRLQRAHNVKLHAIKYCSTN